MTAALLTCHTTKVGTLLLPSGRLSYPNLFKPRAMEGEPEDKAKYGTSVLLPGNVDLALAQKMVEDAATEKWGAEAFKKGKIKRPFLRTEEKVEDKELSGKFPILVRCSSKQRPQIVFANGSVCDSEEDVYPGRWARVSVRAYAWEHKANGRGVSFGLSNVQLLDHDERLAGGKAKAEDEFEPVELSGESGAPQGDASALFG